DLRVAGFSTGACLAEDLFPAAVFDGAVPLPGDAFYYLVRAENQVNVTTYGSPQKDVGINSAAGACTVRFPGATPPPAAKGMLAAAAGP
ncbi:MAG: hypothetical protein ACE5ID_05355, partial [Acidobacteriota bacterium]